MFTGSLSLVMCFCCITLRAPLRQMKPRAGMSNEPGHNSKILLLSVSLGKQNGKPQQLPHPNLRLAGHDQYQAPWENISCSEKVPSVLAWRNLSVSEASQAPKEQSVRSGMHKLWVSCCRLHNCTTTCCAAVVSVWQQKLQPEPCHVNTHST